MSGEELKPAHPNTNQGVTAEDKMERIDEFMIEEIMTDRSGEPHRADDFNGDTSHLIDCIDALLDLDDSKALVPHGVGGRGSHAYRLLCAARHRLSSTAALDAEVERLRAIVARVQQAVAYCPPEDMTAREAAIAADLSAGMSLRQISAKHGVGVGTVRGVNGWEEPERVDYVAFRPAALSDTEGR